MPSLNIPVIYLKWENPIISNHVPKPVMDLFWYWCLSGGTQEDEDSEPEMITREGEVGKRGTRGGL